MNLFETFSPELPNTSYKHILVYKHNIGTLSKDRTVDLIESHLENQSICARFIASNKCACAYIIMYCEINYTLSMRLLYVSDFISFKSS